MSDKSEQMRPIPDGGLKESMPSWLKRPPAWRDLPTVEERHERTLPEPDTSEIDPHSLVDVNDLPQWLQAIAARGELPAPQADEVAATSTEIAEETGSTTSPEVEEALEVLAESPANSVVEETLPAETMQAAVPESSTVTATEAPATSMPSWLMPVAIFAILVIAVVLFYVL